MSVRKLAAVTAAVTAYIRTEEEAALAAAQGGQTLEPAPVAALSGLAVCPRVNAWGMAGRIDQMQGRSLMQLRVFR